MQSRITLEEFNKIKELLKTAPNINSLCRITGKSWITLKQMNDATDFEDYQKRVTEYNINMKKPNTDLAEKITYMKDHLHFTYETIAKRLNIPIDEVKNIRTSQKNKLPNTFQLAVVSRFLQGTDMEKFWKQYEAARLTIGAGLTRKTVLFQPIPKEDLEILKMYVLELDTSLRELSRKTGIPVGSFLGRAGRIAIKIIAQHPKILDEISSGEEVSNG